MLTAYRDQLRQSTEVHDPVGHGRRALARFAQSVASEESVMVRSGQHDNLAFAGNAVESIPNSNRLSRRTCLQPSPAKAFFQSGRPNT